MPRAIQPRRSSPSCSSSARISGLSGTTPSGRSSTNPGRTAALGVMFAAIKDHDGPNDQASRLSRPGVYRLAFQRAPTARAFAALRRGSRTHSRVCV